MAKYLITGAAGFIGSALAQRLINENHDVVTIDNLSSGYIGNIPKEVKFINGDCSNPVVYEKISQDKYDAIFHIAGQSSGEVSFDDPIYDIKTNTESTLLLLKFALRNGCKRFIYAGTMSVYGIKSDHKVSEDESCMPQSFYGVGKLASEHYMRIFQEYGIHSTSLRLFNVYGPGQNMQNLRQGMVSIFLAQMLENQHIHVKGTADRYRDFIHIDDVVESFIRCLKIEKTQGMVINIATGIKTNISKLVDILIASQSNAISVQYEGGTPGDIHGIYSDVANMDRVLGYWEKREINQGVKEMVVYYESRFKK